MPVITPVRPVGSLGFKLLLFCVLVFILAIVLVMWLWLKLSNPNPASVSNINVYTGGDTLPPNTPAPAAIFAAVPLTDDQAALANTPNAPFPPDPVAVAEKAIEMLPDTTPSGYVAPPPGPKNPSDVGLIICEPVAAQSTSSNVSDFGIASGDWLNLIAAGQPELGRTPESASSARIEYELKTTDMCLTPSQAKSLSSIVGVTDVACGSITGSPSIATLSYQLYDVPSLTPVGSTITVSGSLQQIDNDLPAIAKEFDTEVGLSSPTIPKSSSLSPDNLSTLGALTHTSYLSLSDIQTLASLSSTSPLAGFYLLSTYAMDDSVLLNRTVARLLSQQPQNALIINDIGYITQRSLQRYSSQITALCDRYKQSALLSHVDVWDQREWGGRIEELTAALRITEDSPNDPVSWLALRETLDNISEDIRGGRYSSDLSASNLSLLQTFYDQMKLDDTNSVTLDPQYGHGWFELSQDAAFASDGDTAVQAFDKASDLDLDSSEVDDWGFQLYQDKWYGDSGALYGVASRAAARNYDSSSHAVGIAEDLDDLATATGDTRYTVLSQEIMSKIIATDRNLVADSPNDAWNHWELANALAYGSSNLREATKEYRITEHLLPDSAKVHYGLSLVMHSRGKLTPEIVELRYAVSLDPFFVEAHAALGARLKETGQYPEASKELRFAIKLSPTNIDAYYDLGLLAEDQKEPADALKYYQEAVVLMPTAAPAYDGLCIAEDELHRWNDSLLAAQQGLHYEQESPSPDTGLEGLMYDTMADDYINLKDWNDSISQSQQARTLNPNDIWAEENTAEAEWGAGNASQARSDWATVASSSDTDEAAAAKAFLKKTSTNPKFKLTPYFLN